nr:Multifunctional esterase [Paraburkholderia busanensis]
MKMNQGFLNSMHEAMTLLRTRGVGDATQAIQRALRGESAGAADGGSTEHTATGTIFPSVEPVKQGTVARSARTVNADAEERSHFSMLMYSNSVGRRQYRLFVPAGVGSEPLPLIVMLHGCTQDADDFATGTQMNALAEQHRCLVAYPVQPKEANASKCWNWFKPGNQQRDGGEPSLIAGITREIIAAHPIDPARVYVAGMSAGGAMAMIMIESYPDLYAAAGVHSGLPVGCARDLPSALAAMKGASPRANAGPRAGGDGRTPKRPIIVFHGDADSTVHITNAKRLMQGYERQPGLSSETRQSTPNQHDCSVSRLVSSDGIDAELWVIHGAAHAWAGGNVKGSYTDPTGPDASAEMLRFFLNHPRDEGD